MMNLHYGRVRRIAFCIWISGMVYGIAAELQSVAVSSVSDPELPVSDPVGQQGGTSLQTLEKKAAERDLYLARVRELQKKLDLLTGRNDQALMGAEGAEFGQLSRLKEKATLADQLARQVESIRLDNERLVDQRDSLRAELDALKKRSESSETREAALIAENADLETQNAGLRETIGRLLLGEFEYYEVKNGETLQSIAASPLVYDDASRANWLRQANEGRLRNLNDLRDGDMLVVPRFPRTGAYEF